MKRQATPLTCTGHPSLIANTTHVCCWAFWPRVSSSSQSVKASGPDFRTRPVLPWNSSSCTTSRGRMMPPAVFSDRMKVATSTRSENTSTFDKSPTAAMIACFGFWACESCSIFGALSTGIWFVSTDFEIGFFGYLHGIVEALDLAHEPPIGVYVETGGQRLEQFLPTRGEAMLENSRVLALDRRHFPLRFMRAAFSSRPTPVAAPPRK